MRTTGRGLEIPIKYDRRGVAVVFQAMICRQKIVVVVLRNVIQQRAGASGLPGGVVDAVHRDCLYLQRAVRIAYGTDLVIVTSALAAAKQACFSQAAVSLVNLGDFYNRLGHAGRHEDFYHDLITQDNWRPQAAAWSAVAGSERTLHICMPRIVDPEFRPLGHFEAGNAEVDALGSRRLDA